MMGGKKSGFSRTGMESAIRRADKEAKREVKRADPIATAIVLHEEKAIVKHGRKPTASGFIRTLPAETPHDEVLAKLRAAGFKGTKQLVHSVRHQMKRVALGLPKYINPGSRPRKKNLANDETLINKALVMGVAAHANTDRLVKRAAATVVEHLANTRITKLEIDVRARKYICTFETQEEGTL